MKFAEMDPTVTLAAQLADDGGAVILINTLTVPPEDADKLVTAWTHDAALMKAQPGFISTQLHRGIAGSGTFLNYAVWQSTAHFRAAFCNPDFQAQLRDYPDTTTASPHLFRKVDVPGICVA
jgi:heme-degrading monooxygenase HmoA